jgi:ribonuclease T2
MNITTSLFLIFTQFYSPFICKNSKNNSLNNQGCITARNNHIDFSIHGLWPEYTNNSYPSYCNQSAYFNISTIKPIENQLNKYWLSYEADNPSFWKHEYLKHATCFPNVTQLGFFQDGLNLYRQLNTTNFLKNNIKYDTNYNRSLMEQKFNGKFNCNETNNMYVDQFWKCFDLQLNGIDCPVWLNQNSCNKTINFHSW